MVIVESEGGMIHTYCTGVSLPNPLQITNDNASPALLPYITIEEFKHQWGQNTIVGNVPSHLHSRD